jgi:hypothetical protein
MNDHITSLVRRLTGRAAGPIAHWQRRPSGRLQAADTFARQAGWTITRTRLGGRTYRDPRFSQLNATRTPGPPDERARQAAPARRPRVPGASPRLRAAAGRMEPLARTRWPAAPASRLPAAGSPTRSYDCRISKENQL